MPDTENELHLAIKAALRRAQKLVTKLLSAEEAHSLANALGSRSKRQQWIYLANSKKATRFEVGRALVAQSYSLRHQDPQRMRELARLAVRALRIAGSQPGHAILLADALAEGWANLGNAHRICGARRSASRALARASSVLESGSGDPLLLAKVEAFKGSLAMDQRDFARAEKLFKRAVKLFASVGETHLAGQELVTLGSCSARQGRLEEATSALTTAMQLIDVRRDPELAVQCVITLVAAHAEVGQYDQARELVQGWESAFAMGASEVTIWRLRWLDARIAVHLQDLPGAIRELTQVYRAFGRFGLPYDAALSGLDLAAVYATTGDLRSVRRLAEELLQALSADSVAPEARAAFALWVESARAERTSEGEIRGLAGELERIRVQARRRRR